MNALLSQRRRVAARIVEEALAITPADMMKFVPPISSVSSPPKESPTMPIRNAPKKPKASSKTDAMKALNSDVADAPETGEATPASTPAPVAPQPFAGVLRNVAPKPVVRQAPAEVATRTNNAIKNEEPYAEEEDAESTASHGKKPLVAFDAQVWQWVGDSGAFVHIKTGESRQEDEFLKPGGRNEEASDSPDWDAPQDSANDW